MDNKKIFTAGEIAQICKGTLLSGNVNTEIITYERDTRQIEKGDFFVGIKGENFDGSTYYEEAFEKGAIGCLIENVEISIEKLKQYEDKVIIKVENTICAIQDLAKHKRSLYNIPVIAITGSVGKTSTKDIIANVMSQKFKVLKTSGNLNNHIGLPFTILKLDDHEALVIEMGMNHFGEMSVLTQIAKPTVVVFTNIGTSHIGILGSRENILKAKLEILEGMDENGVIILNNDNDLLHEFAEQEMNKYNIKTYGIENKSDYQPENINSKVDGSTFDIIICQKRETIEVPIGGKHFIYNSLASICIGDLFDINFQKIKNGIKTFELTKKRMEIIKTKQEITIVNDSYNASYDSVKPAIEYLKDAVAERKIAVLGDMFELGDYTEEMHKKVGFEVAKNKIDLLVTVGKFSEYIAQEAVKNGMGEQQIIKCETVDLAIQVLEKIAKSGDLILLKASNVMNLNRIATVLTELYNK